MTPEKDVHVTLTGIADQLGGADAAISDKPRQAAGA